MVLVQNPKHAVTIAHFLTFGTTSVQSGNFPKEITRNDGSLKMMLHHIELLQLLHQI